MTLDDRPTHPADLAYVLKFRLDSAPGKGLWTGRIEHLDSGRRHDFSSGEDLLAWLARDHQHLPHPGDDSRRGDRSDTGARRLPDRSPTVR